MLADLGDAAADFLLRVDGRATRLPRRSRRRERLWRCCFTPPSTQGHVFVTCEAGGRGEQDPASQAGRGGAAQPGRAYAT